jgi:SpoVK/Ycf46/Vps4 family AAA+-type ATPase
LSYDRYDETVEEIIEEGCQQWSTNDGQTFKATGNARKTLPPATYELQVDYDGVSFVKVKSRSEELLAMDGKHKEILDEISKFWDLKDKFNEIKMPHKRGFLLTGPAGTGKSSIVELVGKEVNERDGVVFEFKNVGAFSAAYRVFRNIQPDTPIVLIMEDLDSLMEGNESDILNLLDGVNGIDGVAIIATSNHPDEIDDRVLRPSRIDKTFLIDFPEESTRRHYISHVLGDDGDIEKWTSDTDGLSFADIKELYIATNLFRNDYEETLSRLRGEEPKEECEDLESIKRAYEFLISAKYLERKDREKMKNVADGLLDIIGEDVIATALRND